MTLKKNLLGFHSYSQNLADICNHKCEGEITILFIIRTPMNQLRLQLFFCLKTYYDLGSSMSKDTT